MRFHTPCSTCGRSLEHDDSEFDSTVEPSFMGLTPRRRPFLFATLFLPGMGLHEPMYPFVPMGCPDCGKVL